MLRKGCVLLRQHGELFFRGKFRLDQTGVHKLLVIDLGFADGLVGDSLHLLVSLDGDAYLARTVQVLYMDVALSVGKCVKR